MKKLFLLSTAVFVLSPAAAYAQGAITIIHEDGSKDVVDLSKKAAPLPPAEDVAPQAPAASEPGEAVAAPAPVKETDTRKPKPSPKPAAKPRPKPAPVVEEAKPVPPPIPVQRAQPMGQGLSKKQAIMIALDYAPPSSDVSVLPSATDDGYPALAVRFKTDDGYTDVILDNVTGKVLDTQEFRNTGEARPGYLQ